MNNFTQTDFFKLVDKVLIDGGHLPYDKCKCTSNDGKPEGACKKANDKKKKK